MERARGFSALNPAGLCRDLSGQRHWNLLPGVSNSVITAGRSATCLGTEPGFAWADGTSNSLEHDSVELGNMVRILKLRD